MTRKILTELEKNLSCNSQTRNEYYSRTSKVGPKTSYPVPFNAIQYQPTTLFISPEQQTDTLLVFQLRTVKMYGQTIPATSGLQTNKLNHRRWLATKKLHLSVVHCTIDELPESDLSNREVASISSIEYALTSYEKHGYQAA